MVDIAFLVSYFIDLFGVPARRNLRNHVVQTIHFPGEKKKGHGGPLRQLGAGESGAHGLRF